jgi:hypothetical protein
MFYEQTLHSLYTHVTCDWLNRNHVATLKICTKNNLKKKVELIQYAVGASQLDSWFKENHSQITTENKAGRFIKFYKQNSLVNK